MDTERFDNSLESRPPTLDDLVELCKSLNNRNVKYIVIGGMAVINAGLPRATVDIDIMVDASADNMENVINALMYLPDKAVKELKVTDVENYTVVKVADEIVIDLMKSACGITYEEANKSIYKVKIQDVEIPFASIELLYKMKQTLREKDKSDLLFLEEKLKNKKNQ
ncbi:MAG: hypothetical protein HXY48_09300 [Ignavibacteriaceae bacterium]|nr:hypothetical protein [Ignavibacteriaceae bacterium]